MDTPTTLLNTVGEIYTGGARGLRKTVVLAQAIGYGVTALDTASVVPSSNEEAGFVIRLQSFRDGVAPTDFVLSAESVRRLAELVAEAESAVR